MKKKQTTHTDCADKVFTGFRHGRRSKDVLLREAQKRGWSVSQLVENIVDDWIRTR